MVGSVSPADLAQAAGFPQPLQLDFGEACDDSDGSADFDEMDAPAYFSGKQVAGVVVIRHCRADSTANGLQRFRVAWFHLPLQLGSSIHEPDSVLSLVLSLVTGTDSGAVAVRGLAAVVAS